MSTLPTLAIVGRPNVGKSTLFNRLTGKRAALVSDTPGLTRDRREGEASVGGRAVRLVDTAGLEEAAADSIAARMRAQTETAIAAADAVLFLIDARAGVMPADAAFARVVRAAGRPAILVANKCEGRGGQEGFYEAFALGLGEPVAVSAEHGEGIGELTGHILAALGLDGEADRDDAQPPQSAVRPMRVAIVGRPNTGKSTLVNALLGQQRMITGPEPGLTRDAVASDFVWHGRALRLFDTAGLRRKAKIAEQAEKLSASDAIRAIRFAEVAVLLLDAAQAFEHQDLALGDRIAEEGRAVVVAVNKWDLVTDKQKRLAQLRELAADKLAQIAGVAVVPISALAERGLDKLMTAVLEAYELWNRRVATADLNRWLGEALARHPPPAVHGKRLKIRYMTQASARPPAFVAFCSRPADLPKVYTRYLVNGLRDAFDLPGVPIRFYVRGGHNPY
ncbi:MAG: ribosome biogenesis GTPase Der, partial [Hyphomicrobiaceae bacterium]